MRSSKRSRGPSYVSSFTRNGSSITVSLSALRVARPLASCDFCFQNRRPALQVHRCPNLVHGNLRCLPSLIRAFVNESPNLAGLLFVAAAAFLKRPQSANQVVSHQLLVFDAPDARAPALTIDHLDSLWRRESFVETKDGAYI